MFTLKYLSGFDVSDVINPFPPGILHSAIVAAAALVIFSFLPKRHLAVLLGLVVGLCASLLWRQVNFTFARSWDHFIYRPLRDFSIFDALFWRPPVDWAYCLFLALYWLLPIIVAYVGIWARTRFLQSGRTKPPLSPGAGPEDRK